MDFYGLVKQNVCVFCIILKTLVGYDIDDQDMLVCYSLGNYLIISMLMVCEN